MESLIRFVRPILHDASVRFSSSKSRPLDVASLLREPSWSIHALLPSSVASTPGNSNDVTLKDLEHLSILSALPVPEDPTPSLEALRSHLQFVSAVREVEASDVLPLQSLRDETKEGEKAAEFGIQELKEILKGEEVIGKFHKRIRRKKGARDAISRENSAKTDDEWDALGMAKRKMGRYFVVDRVVKAGDGEGG